MFIALSSPLYAPAKENALDRHDNPETSLRKPVRRIDVHGNATEYKSLTAAAAASDYGKKKIRNKCTNRAKTSDGIYSVSALSF
jgi:hypothetical protein